MIIRRALLGITLLMCVSTFAATELKEVPMIYVPTLTPDIVMSNGFTPHRGFAGTGYRIEPLHRAHSPMDYKAWHDDSWEHLTTLFGRAWGWPREMPESQNAEDLETKHYVRFLAQDWISYTVMTPNGQNVIGSIYITPVKCGSYGGHVMYWISSPYRDAIEKVFHTEVSAWMNKVWPWGSTYMPGPQMSDFDRGSEYVKMENGTCP